MSLYEINQAATVIRETAHPDVNLIFGAVIDENMGEKIRITVIATGFEHTTPMMRSMTRSANQNRQTAPQSPPVQPKRETVSISSNPQSRTSPRSRPTADQYPPNNLDLPAFLRKRR